MIKTVRLAQWDGLMPVLNQTLMSAFGRKGAFAPVLMIWCIENLGTQVYVTQTSVSDASDSLSVCF